jgi:hypothetical protein
MIAGSVSVSETNITLARLHLETALKLTSREFLADWFASVPVVTSHALTPVPETIELIHSTSPAVAKTTKRGRKPGAASPESRCIWKMTTGDQCRNGRRGTSEYCKIHISKTHIIAPTPQ